MSETRASVLGTICAAFGIELNGHDCAPFGNGLINQTFLLRNRHGDDHWILQQVNTTVFKQPQLIAYNNYLAAEHLRNHHPEYRFMRGLRTTDDRDLFISPDLGAWRVFPYFPNTVSHEGAVSPQQAYSAAQQFGLLTRNLEGVYVGAFKTIIPDFHDLAARYALFQQAVRHAPAARKESARDAINHFIGNASIVDEFKVTMMDPEVRTRITHNDTKVNNVLFDKDTGQAVCVVDLDTLMPGKTLFDLGDMIRTFISPAAEDDPDPGHTEVNEEVFVSLVEGYFSEMAPLMSLSERSLVHWCGQMLIYEQGIRFLTDHLQGDLYYRIDREGHNLDRALNQVHLLKRYMALQRPLNDRIRHLVA
ncbi:MAG: aminoglycoside phosphotransferase family protein [Flavobacteriales bacterium]|nr:aminoglycoside phosphotransferase family protein [Flavobacteriales bacterium]